MRQRMWLILLYVSVLITLGFGCQHSRVFKDDPKVIVAPAQQDDPNESNGESAECEERVPRHLKLEHTFIAGPGFQGIPVTYIVVDDWAVVEGDIVLGTVTAAREVANAVSDSESRDPKYRPFGLVIAGENYRWPGAIVYYNVDPTLSNPQRVEDAIKEWESKTKARFKKHTTEVNYVTFQPSNNGCMSRVGMVGGQQFISLGENCSTGNAIHEIGHTLGLWHEQSRSDRNTYVEIKWDNVIPSLKFNFDQHVTDGVDAGEYDYNSIMHYGKSAFAIDRSKPTIMPKKAGGENIGQRGGLSSGDVAAFKKMYGP